MARPRKVKESEVVKEDSKPIESSSYVYKSPTHDQAKDLKMLLWLKGYSVSDDKLTYTKAFHQKNYVIKIVFLSDKEVDYTRGETKTTMHVSDVFNWID